MNDDKDDDFFGKGFPFFGGFSDHFKDMNREMEEMSRQFEEMFRNARIEFHPPNMDGKSPPLKFPGDFPPMNSPPLKFPGGGGGGAGTPPTNPRDQMLKSDDSDDKTNMMKGSQDQSPVPQRPRISMRRLTPEEKERLSSPSSSTTNNKPIISGVMRSVQTVQLSDGSTKKIETTVENGQTCKTVTITDPKGETTTTTSCERLNIDGIPLGNLPEGAAVFTIPFPEMNPGAPNPGVPNPGVSNRGMPGVNTDLTKEDASFFSKLFGGFWSKPKS